MDQLFYIYAGDEYGEIKRNGPLPFIEANNLTVLVFDANFDGNYTYITRKIEKMTQRKVSG